MLRLSGRDVGDSCGCECGFRSWKPEFNPRPVCEGFVVEKCHCTRFPPSASLFPCQCHSATAPYPFVHHPGNRQSVQYRSQVQIDVVLPPNENKLKKSTIYRFMFGVQWTDEFYCQASLSNQLYIYIYIYRYTSICVCISITYIPVNARSDTSFLHIHYVYY